MKTKILPALACSTFVLNLVGFAQKVEAAKPHANVEAANVQVKDGLVLFGDMAVPESSLPKGFSLDPSTQDTPHSEAASMLNLVPWDDGILPLKFSGSFSDEEKEKVFSACADWEKLAHVHCIEGNYKGRHLKITKAWGGCWALWGMGNHFLVLHRRMNLGKGCMSHATILHELGHAFGLIHEHQRPDRDPYIEIHGENVSKGFLGLQFKVNFNTQDAITDLPYDFLSIMHYDRKAFSKNGKDTIVPRPGFEQYIDVMGRVEELSPEDGQAVARIYGQP
jgi:hypothetical protein